MQECIVCGAPATREAKSQVQPAESAWVCGAAHARTYLRSVRSASRKAAASPAAPVEGKPRVEDPRQLTFLGGKPVRKR